MLLRGRTASGIGTRREDQNRKRANKHRANKKLTWQTLIRSSCDLRGRNEHRAHHTLISADNESSFFLREHITHPSLLTPACRQLACLWVLL